MIFMKNSFVICIIAFGLSFFLACLVAFANQTDMPSYNASPSGSYTKIQLINKANALSSASFCLTTNTGAIDPAPTSGHTYVNTGTIFADGTTGYLEICKSDGTMASYPGSCFNRFGSGGTLPSCPSNYQVTNAASQSFSMIAGSPVISWSCCFTGQGNAVGAAIAKSGCFSIYSTTAQPVPDSCSSEDPNAYDIGCDYISASDMPIPVYKRNCCFNASSGTLGTSQCGGTCTNPSAVASDTICDATPPPVNEIGTVVGIGVASCPVLPVPCDYYCNAGYNNTTVPNTCTPDPCLATNETSGGDSVPFPLTSSGSSDTESCTAGYTGSLTYSCSLGSWSYVTGSCSPNPCLATIETSGGDNVPFPVTSSGSSATESCTAGYTGSLKYSCSLGSWSYVSGSCVPNSCPATNETSGGDSVPFPLTSSGSSATESCTAGYTGSLTYSCSLGSWSYVNGSCAAAPCLATNETSGGDSVPFPLTSSGSSDTELCTAGYTGSLTYSCSYGSWSYVTGSCVPNIDGICGVSNDTCTAGTPTGDSGNGTGIAFTWTCDGSGTGTNASCGPICSAGYTVSGTSCVAFVNGICGVTNNTCTAGTPAGDSGNGTSIAFKWTCDGTGTGTNASCGPICSAGYSVSGSSCVAIVNGSCGATNNTCTAGTPTGDSGNGTSTAFIWTCDGSGTGTNAGCGPICSAGYSLSGSSCVAIVNGSCGATNNTCTAGTPTGDSGNGTSTAFTWTCDGSGTGTNAGCGPICSAGYSLSGSSCVAIVNGSCGATNNTCTAGTPTGDSGDGTSTPFMWTCNGSGGGINASCGPICSAGYGVVGTTCVLGVGSCTGAPPVNATPCAGAPRTGCQYT